MLYNLYLSMEDFIFLVWAPKRLGTYLLIKTRNLFFLNLQICLSRCDGCNNIEVYGGSVLGSYVGGIQCDS